MRACGLHIEGRCPLRLRCPYTRYVRGGYHRGIPGESVIREFLGHRRVLALLVCLLPVMTTNTADEEASGAGYTSIRGRIEAVGWLHPSHYRNRKTCSFGLKSDGIVSTTSCVSHKGCTP